MSLISDLVEDIGDLSEFSVSDDPVREAVPINAIIAQVSPEGEAVAVTVNDEQSDLALGGYRYRKPTEIQIDIYASQYTRLMAMKQQIIDRYHGKRLVIGETTFKSITVEFAAESAATLNNTVYRAIISLEAIT